MVPRHSAPGGFSYIWQSEWVGIIAIKTERTEIPFLSDVLVAVASLDLKVLNVYRRLRDDLRRVSCLLFLQSILVRTAKSNRVRLAK